LSSLCMRDRVSRTYTTTSVRCVLIFMI
jgi:hypothetical protein